MPTFDFSLLATCFFTCFDKAKETVNTALQKLQLNMVFGSVDGVASKIMSSEVELISSNGTWV
jgi:hypothetical protein